MVLAEVANISLPTRIPDWNNWCWFKFGFVSFSSYIGELIVIAKSMTAAITARTIVNTINCTILIPIFIEYTYVSSCCSVAKPCKCPISTEKYIMSINMSIVAKVPRKAACVLTL